jgi:NADH:ubiquinone oxidoreductase subunit 6 (subunit J)
LVVVVFVVVVVLVIVVVVARLRRKNWPKFRTKQTNKLTAIGEKILSTFVRPEEICCLTVRM